VLATLFDPDGPYVSRAGDHQGLLLHSVYHRPNGVGSRALRSPHARGESSQWGDYHAREVALYALRLARNEPYLTFFGPEEGN
jgi:unsaturated chondroitin disaccharide hydrolase